MKLTDKEKEQRVKDGIQCGFFRRAMGLTIKQCAERLGVSQQTVNNIESGKQSPFELEFIKKAYGYKKTNVGKLIYKLELSLDDICDLMLDHKYLIDESKQVKEKLKQVEGELKKRINELPHNRGVKLSERTLQWLKENKDYLESL